MYREKMMLPAEMLNSADMTVLERQRTRLKWQQHEQQQQQHQQVQFQMRENESCFGDLSGGVFHGGCLGEVVTPSLKPDPESVHNGWPEFLGFGFPPPPPPPFEMNNYGFSRTASCPPTVVMEEAAAAANGREPLVSEKLSSLFTRESFKKRKVVAEEEIRDKRFKGCAEEADGKINKKIDSKSSSSSNNKKNKNINNNNNNNKENSGENSKDNSKVTEVQKPDYIHVRARRGQATDSHSLAERVRREKISERMKYLQDLVPGCNKITGKAGMLDEIINYVQSLQRQVEFLSMKLAAVNPRLDFNIDNLLDKEVFSASATKFPDIAMSSESDILSNAAYFPFNPIQQQMVTCGLDLGVNPPDMGLRRTISTPVSLPDAFLDASCFTQIQPSSTWDADLQNLYDVAFEQGRSTPFHSQPFTGAIDANNLKMEM